MDLRNSEHPYLSVVVTARNDDHGGNMLGRMQIFVTALIAQAKRYNLASELIIVEWNPPEGRPSLKEALEWPSGLGPCRVRFITVPPALHARHRHSEALPLFQMIAKNVGIRRARGRFVLATNIDILMSDELAQYLAQEKLEMGRMYRVDRHDVMSDVPAGKPVDEQLAYCRSHLIRVNMREGTFRVTPDGGRALEAHDIAAPDSGVTFGAGWFALEGALPEGVYRWVDNEAEVFVNPPGDPPPLLVFDIEPAFGAARPFTIEVATEGLEPASIVVERRTNVEVQLPSGARSLRFRVIGGGSPSPYDPRVVNFRVFRCGWGSGRGARLIREQRGIFKRARRLLAQGRAAAGEAKPSVSPAEAAGGLQTPPVFLHTNACGDFTLMAREHWLDLRGYPEFELHAMNLDSVLCYTAHHGGLCEETLRDPCRIYHIEHAAGSGWTPEGEGKLYARLAASGIPRLDHRELMGWAAQMRRFDSTMIFNREDWGLAHEQLAETALPATISTATR